MVKIVSLAARVLVCLVKLSNAGIALSLLIKQQKFSIPLVIIAPSQIIGSLFILITMINHSLKWPLRSKNQLNIINLILLTTTFITITCGIYWISDIVFENVSENDLQSRQLLVSFVSTLIPSIFFDPFTYLKTDNLPENTKYDIENQAIFHKNENETENETRIPSYKSFNLSHFEKSSNGFSSSNTVKEKTSAQTLVASFMDLNNDENNNQDHCQSIKNLRNKPSLLQFSGAKSQNIDPQGNISRSNGNQFDINGEFGFDQVQADSTFILPDFESPTPTPIKNTSTGICASATTPRTPSSFNFPETITEEHSSYVSSHRNSNNNKAYSEDLDDVIETNNLGAIPIVSPPQWPLQNSDRSDANGLNHISLDSWERNADKWHFHNERIGRSKSIFFNGDEPGSKTNFKRSISEPLSINSNTNQNQITPQLPQSNMLIEQNHYDYQNHILQQYQIQYPNDYEDKLVWNEPYIPPRPMTPSKTVMDDDSEENEYKTIMNESFASSYEHIAKLSMSSLADIKNAGTCVISDKDRASGQLSPINLGFPQESLHSRSSSIKNSPGLNKILPSPTATLRKSRSNSPLKRLKSLRKLSISGTSSSRPSLDDSEFNFELLKSVQQQQQLQNSPKRHRHRKTASTISLRTSNIKSPSSYYPNSANNHHVNAFSMSNFDEIIKASSDYSQLKGMKFSTGSDDDDDDDDDLTDNELFHNKNTPESDKSKASMPSVVIGQYDREKWTTIQNKLTSESANILDTAN